MEVMRVFVLTTGRSGSRTWFKACEHIKNYTSGHESQASKLEGRLDYPDNHIEVDNRLSFFLGTLDWLYGDDPVYVHLYRDPEATALSFLRETYKGRSAIMPAFHGRILRRAKMDEQERLAVAKFYVRSTNHNIRQFLKDKSRVVRTTIEGAGPGFVEMCEMIGAVVDLEAAHRELTTEHGRSR